MTETTCTCHGCQVVSCTRRYLSVIQTEAFFAGATIGVTVGFFAFMILRYFAAGSI